MLARRPARTLLVALALAAAGCQAPAGPKPTARTASAAPSARPAATDKAPTRVATLAGVVRAPLAVIKNAGALIGNDGSTLIGNDGSTLIGNDGSTLIGNDGSTLVGNDGASYRLQAVTGQAPVRGATVRLLDAAGEPLRADGQAIVTTTDEAGRYAFQAVLPPGPAVVVVDLGQTATLRAIAPDAAAAAREADVEIVSTLTTAYIFERFLAARPDKAAALAKLTAAAEAATRQAARDLLARTGVKIPVSLAAAGLATAVEGLRKQDQALDAQLEAVKRLLIPVGLGDLGAGSAATSVAIGAADALAEDPAGGLFVLSSEDHRVWRVTPEGKLETYVGSGSTSDGSVEGRPAAQVGLDYGFEIATDAQGRLLYQEWLYARPDDATQVVRVARDAARTCTVVGVVPWGITMLPGDGEEVWVVSSDEDGEKLLLGKLAPGKAYQLVRELALDEDADFEELRLAHRDAQGRLVLEDGDRHWRVDPQGAAPPELLDWPGAVALDVHGNWFSVDPAAQTHALHAPDGQVTPLGTLPGESWGDGPILRAGDGALYSAEADGIWRTRDGQRERVAGLAASQAGQAERLDLVRAGGVVPDADGVLLVADRGNGRIYKVEPGRKPTLFAGNQAPRPADLRQDAGRYRDDGKPAREAWFVRPGRMLREAAGSLLVVDDVAALLPEDEEADVALRVRRIAVDGTVTTLYEGEAEDAVDVAADARGTVYLTVGATLRKLGEDAALAEEPEEEDFVGVAVAPDGTVWLGTGGTLYRWTAAAGLQAAVRQAGLLGWADDGTEVPGHLACDARGRVYVTGNEPHQVLRYDPANPAAGLEVLAGPGGKRFSGGGVDDGLLGPAFPAFAPNGDLYFADVGHKQIKRLPAAEL